MRKLYFASLANLFIVVSALCGAPCQAGVLVSDVGSDSVLEFDAATGAFLGTFASGGGLDVPTGMTFGPDGNLCMASDANDILRYNGTTGAFIDQFMSGGGIIKSRYLTFGLDGNLYVAQTFEFVGGDN